ncbi:aspartyl-tRNA synthetase [Pilibacter termitis]|uniref:Aspartate--tRNA ligase n=1 Tax=Pilibacter termitis TaxID=263852 RepID=A0A1T4PIY6_9ENTE|nr:aspartate--tRNA ligase [Pilibacter termitis]SJZ91156.1 aspartyl-tRNA synthetase [Pilibacter termitis]
MKKRTNYCGNITEEYLNQTVTVQGWVARRRNLGGLVFLDIRDREGIVQVVVNPELASENVVATAEKLRSEFVVEITGKVVERTSKNDKLKTGGIEIEANEVEILSSSKTTPFEITDDTTASDDTRLRYRYLDLRRPEMLENFKLRHKLTKAARHFLDEQDFIDVETPILNKSTPEGARDYLVPSRIHEGHFYALPQSPQIFKQLLMNAGFDRYYQIAKCFRDEDLRGDRQPEFTQIDLETSFLSAEEIQTLTEGMIARVMKEVKGIDVTLPFPRMDYDVAMSRYGSDKPDTRFGMELVDLSEIAKNVEFKVFSSALENGGQVKAICVPQAAEKYSRKDIDKLTQIATQYGAKGLAWVKVTDEGVTGPIAKFLGEIESELLELCEAKSGDMLLFAADTKEIVAATLGGLRTRLGKELGLIDESKFNFLWVVNWPMFEWSEEENRYMSAHHPFTLPFKEDIEKLENNDLANVYAEAYDIVLNGYELGGGSLRIFTRELQEKMFKALGFTQEAANEQFGFLLEALDYGFPPHGGLALGLDRFAMILANTDNIREVIAFPKNAKASDPMSDAPSVVSAEQLGELRLRVVEE